MAGNIQHGAVVISIDVDADLHVLSSTAPAALERTTLSLLKILSQAHLFATWCSVAPAGSRAIEHVGDHSLDHEVGLLGMPSWAGPDAGRGKFGRELARHVSESELAGLKITSLAFRGSDSGAAWDLAAEHGIKAIRRAVPDNSAPPTGALRLLSDLRQAVRAAPLRATQPRCVHLGIWNLPATLAIPAATGTRQVSPARILAGLDTCFASGGVFHLSIDLPRMVLAGTASHRSIAQLIAEIAARKSRHDIRNCTLADVASRLATKPASPAARSILRAA